MARGGARGLQVEGLVAGYHGGTVLDHVTFSVAPGESVALLGRNGVGKTTFLRTIMGLNRPKAGKISYGGRRIDGRQPFEIARAGLGYVPQGREIFADLTVEENLLLGNLKATDADDIYTLFPALAQKRQLQGGRLSGGQQQQLAIGRALMGRPGLLLLDEPSEGIQPSVVMEISTILSDTVRSRGMSLVLVEQNIDMALGLAHRVDFMEEGRIVASAPAEALRTDQTLIEQHMAL